MFFEISALNGQNVHVLFNEVAKKLTGITSDLIKQSNIVSNAAPAQVIEAGAASAGYQ